MQKMKKNIKSGLFLKSIVLLMILFTLPGLVVAIIHYYDEKAAAPFVAKFEKIQLRDTARSVMETLGPPDRVVKVVRSDIKDQKIYTQHDLPYAEWYYSVRYYEFVIIFEPVMSVDEDPMNWEVIGKAPTD